MTKEILDSTNNTQSLYSSRILIIQTIYSFDILDNKKDIKQISSDYINYYTSKYPNKKLHVEFYEDLINFIINNISNIDNKIHSNLEKNWKLERLPKLVLSILRSGIGELLHVNNSNVAVIINDYLQITKSFNHLEELGFINSILDKIVNKN